jgi:hypothetical protein
MVTEMGKSLVEVAGDHGFHDATFGGWVNAAGTVRTTRRLRLP